LKKSKALVFKVREDNIENFLRYLKEYKSVETIEAKSPHEAFRAKYGATLIIGYRTGKVIANSQEAKPIVSKILETLEVADYDIIIGSDEAGKGEWLGPMTVAAVALTPKQSTTLRSEGVMDSKELRPHKIKELRRRIVESCLSHRVLTIGPERFNRMLEEFRREDKTLNDILAWGHATVIGKVHDEALEVYMQETGLKSPRARLLIDEFDRLRTEARLRRTLDLRSLKVTQEPKAEQEIAVAAAGILAKAAREAWVENRSKELGKDLRNLSPHEIARMGYAEKMIKLSYVKPAGSANPKRSQS